MKNFVLRASGRLRAAARLAPRVLVSLKGKRRKQALPPVSDTTVLESPSLMAVLTSSSHTIVVNGEKARRSKARAIAKDTLLFSLKALAESADAFPPLKSAVGGLLFFADQIELVTSNKEQIRDIYAQIDAFAASLESSVPDATALSPALEAAIQALAKGIEAVCMDMEAIEGQRNFLRTLRAKQHSAELQGLVRRLDVASESFARAVLTSTETKTTQVLGYVQLLREDIHTVIRRARKLFFLPSPQPRRMRATILVPSSDR